MQAQQEVSRRQESPSQSIALISTATWCVGTLCLVSWRWITPAEQFWYGAPLADSMAIIGLSTIGYSLVSLIAKLFSWFRRKHARVVKMRWIMLLAGAGITLVFASETVRFHEQEAQKPEWLRRLELQ
jgi:hypothetical protein